jgi:hypothetical protein
MNPRSFESPASAIDVKRGGFIMSRSGREKGRGKIYSQGALEARAEQLDFSHIDSEHSYYHGNAIYDGP